MGSLEGKYQVVLIRFSNGVLGRFTGPAVVDTADDPDFFIAGHVETMTHPTPLPPGYIFEDMERTPDHGTH